jgi:hypothetical protein
MLEFRNNSAQTGQNGDVGPPQFHPLGMAKCVRPCRTTPLIPVICPCTLELYNMFDMCCGASPNLVLK